MTVYRWLLNQEFHHGLLTPQPSERPGETVTLL